MLNKVKPLIFSFMVVLLCTACTSTPSKVSSSDTSSIKVFMSAPKVAFKIIAPVEVMVQDGVDMKHRLENTVAKLKEKVVALGGNAVIVNNAESFAAQYNRVSTGTVLSEGMSLDDNPSAFQNVKLKGEAIILE